MAGPLDRWSPWRVCGVASAVVIVVSAAAASGIRTFSHAADWICGLAAVAAYAVAMTVAWRIRPRAAGVAVGAVISAPLLALIALLGWLGDGAVLGLAFALVETTTPPEHTEELSPTLSCRVYGWGAAFTDEGYTVHVYRHAPFFPFLQFEVAHVTIDQSDFNARPRSATCASVAAGLRR